MTDRDISAAQHWIDVFRHAQEKRKEFEEMEKGAREEILSLLGANAETGSINGRPVLTYERRYQRRISIADLRERYPEIALELETEAEVRIFKLVNTEGESK